MATAIGLLGAATASLLVGLVAHLALAPPGTAARVISGFGVVFAAAAMAGNAAKADGPRRLTIRDGAQPAFRAGPRARSRVFSAAVVLLGPLLAGCGLGSFGWLALPVVGALGVAHLLALFVGRPAVTLTPEGVEVAGVARRRFVPWSAMRPGTPRVEAHSDWLLGLTVDRPELVRGGKRRVWLPVRHLDIEPDFLAEALRHYVDVPERRAAIGTVTEHAALLAELESNGAQPQRDSRDGPDDRGRRRVAPPGEVGPLRPAPPVTARLARHSRQPVGDRDLG